MTIQEQAQYLFGSAAEVRKLAFLAHNVPGYFLIACALLIFLAGLGIYRKKLTYGYNFLLLFISLTFTGFIFLNKGIQNIPIVTRLIFAYPEVSVHLIMVVVAIIGTSLEILYEKGMLKNKLFHLSFPFVLLTIGYINILHPHAPVHTESDSLIHAVMGTLLTLSGLFLIMNRLSKGTSSKAFLILGTLSLIGAGSMFAIYKDSPIAYEYAFPVKQIPITSDFIDVGNFGVVYIYKDYVTPHKIRLKAGGKLEFMQADASIHEMSSGPHPYDNEYPPLALGVLAQGESKIVEFQKPATHSFHDHLKDENQSLSGVVVVYR